MMMLISIHLDPFKYVFVIFFNSQVGLLVFVIARLRRAVSYLL